jgi:glutamate-1-semialdehyde 2,1-aminomutase
MSDRPAAAPAPLGRLRGRLALSRAKHRSLAGHTRIGRRLARLLRYYEHDAHEFLRADGCPEDIAAQRQAGLAELALLLTEKAPCTLELTEELRDGLSNLAFTDAYRVPYPHRAQLRRQLRVGALAEASEGVRIRDLDGNWSYDLAGSYGVNVFGLDFYKECIDRAALRVRELGPVLGPYHPVILDNVRRLQELSGQDEVSFHMEGSEAALRVLETRRDIACVLVNPLQALHPNAPAPGDSTLLNSRRRAHFDKTAYAAWLSRLRDVCTRRGIALILDEVFLGFRVARGGVQEYFGVAADLVTYGKTLGGGLPIGVVCGRRELMKRYREDRPSDVLFARGTFNARPYVMAAMNEFLQRLDEPELRESYAGLDARWDGRAAELNGRLEQRGLPVRFANLTSVWTTLSTLPSRYNWMFQFCLRAEGLALAWVGSGRLIFSHAYRDEDFREVAGRIERAAEKMAADGWWWWDGTQTDAAIDRSILKRVLLLLVAHGVHRVVALRLEEEVADLAQDPRQEPAGPHRLRRVEGEQAVGQEEAAGAEQMEALVDAAVVVEAVIVPALLAERAAEAGPRGHGRLLLTRPPPRSRVRPRPLRGRIVRVDERSKSSGGAGRPAVFGPRGRRRRERGRRSPGR